MYVHILYSHLWYGGWFNFVTDWLAVRIFACVWIWIYDVYVVTSFVLFIVFNKCVQEYASLHWYVNRYMREYLNIKYIIKNTSLGIIPDICHKYAIWKISSKFTSSLSLFFSFSRCFSTVCLRRIHVYALKWEQWQ